MYYVCAGGGRDTTTPTDTTPSITMARVYMAAPNSPNDVRPGLGVMTLEFPPLIITVATLPPMCGREAVSWGWGGGGGGGQVPGIWS